MSVISFRAILTALPMLSISATAQVPTQPTFYVSASGDDRAEGVSLATAFQTLERARDAARAANGAATIYLSGRFERSTPFRLEAVDLALTVASVSGAMAEIVAAHPETQIGILVNGADSVALTRLSFSGFASDGILVKDAKNVRITYNRVIETRSSKWSQGAIHLTGTVSGAIVSGNVVQGAGYAGIIVDTDQRSDVSRVRITDNTVVDTCRRVADCGAIYVNDRGRRSKGVEIRRNSVAGFGPTSVGGRGIYLDDWASGVLVSDNDIAGPGKFAFQIHGGHSNRIERNRIDLRQIDEALLAHPVTVSGWADMTGNVVEDNRFEVLSTAPAPRLSKVANLRVRGNQACARARCAAIQ